VRHPELVNGQDRRVVGGSKASTPDVSASVRCAAGGGSRRSGRARVGAGADHGQPPDARAERRTPSFSTATIDLARATASRLSAAWRQDGR
jgi:hypothetical protein